MENRDKNQNIGSSNIGNKNLDKNLDKDRDVSQGGFGSSTGRSGSVGNMGGGGSDLDRNESSPSRSGKLGDESSNVDRGSSSERH